MVFALALSLIAPTVHVTVDGEGYLRFVREGRTVYAREADLTVVDGKLASPLGPVLNPRVQVPAEVTELTVDLSGIVFGESAGVKKELGRIVLAMFPEDVRLVVDNGFLVSSYRPEVSDPGVGLAGVVRTAAKSTTTVAQATVAGVEIQLRDSVEVEGKSFSVGEIATVVAEPGLKARIEAFEVSTTPALGVPYRMTSEMVRQRLMRYGKEAEKYKFSGAGQVTVTRRGQVVTSAQFTDAAVAAAKAREDTEWAAESSGVSVSVPIGKLELVAESTEINGARATVRVAIVVDGVRINSRTVALQKSDALSKLRVGQTVKLLVKSGTAVVETTGKVRAIDRANGSVSVTSATGADLVGKAVGIDTVEVVL
jgi:hypothetical protein